MQLSKRVCKSEYVHYISSPRHKDKKYSIFQNPAVKLNTSTNNSLETTAFTDAEKAVIASLIEAIAAAATSSVGPAARLAAGLSATGVTGLNGLVQSAQAAIVALQAAAEINWTVT